MKRKLTEYEEFLLGDLSWLISQGRYYASTVEGVSNMLENEFLGKRQLSDDQKRQLFRISIDAGSKYLNLIDEAVKQQKEYLDSIRESNEDIQT